ncbi:MAG: hypothetical protein COB33_012605 [Thiotrichaceae bacterium]|nr:hypothetical protein [Thiotrichaceae bacterium]PCI14844.1 MAG: hypothetical protein COB71_01990 [Thiotrichales bacterium]
MDIRVSVSAGECLDKITILEIKAVQIKDEAKLININHELKILQDICAETLPKEINISTEMAELKSVNEALWEIEDDIRDKELAGEFDQRFIELARSVYVTNDKRATLKRVLNEKLGSKLVEEKSYTDYQQQ